MTCAFVCVLFVCFDVFVYRRLDVLFVIDCVMLYGVCSFCCCVVVRGCFLRMC